VVRAGCARNDRRNELDAVHRSELAAILDDDLTSAWEQVGAWFSADAMLDDAASKLSEARTGLAAVWPPESSPAAQTFFRWSTR